MKRTVVVLLAASLLMSALAACGGGSISPGLGEKFALKAGETGDITAEGLTIKFEEVLNDSRCPDGATCIWAGQVQCLVTIDLTGKKEQITLTQLGSAESTTQTYNRYHLVFNVTPYPKLNQAITSTDYRLNLTVTRIS